MEDAQRLRVKRRGLKGSITKLTGKVQEALTTELETVNAESVPESRSILISGSFRVKSTRNFGSPLRF